MFPSGVSLTLAGLGESGTLDHLHDEIVPAYVEQSAYARMIQRGDRPSLPLEMLAEFLFRDLMATVIATAEPQTGADIGETSIVDRNSHAGTSTTSRRFVLEAPTRSFWLEIDEILIPLALAPTRPRDERLGSPLRLGIARVRTKGSGSLFQRLPHPLRDCGGHLIEGETHRALEAVGPGDQHAHAVAERIGSYRRFVRCRDVPAASDHRRHPIRTPAPPRWHFYAAR
jgi:hypothetical protein